MKQKYFVIICCIGLFLSGIDISNALTPSESEIREKAEQGDAVAQNNLALMYVRGEGVLQDYKLAVKWFTRPHKYVNTYFPARNDPCRLLKKGVGDLSRVLEEIWRVGYEESYSACAARYHSFLWCVQ